MPQQVKGQVSNFHFLATVSQQRMLYSSFTFLFVFIYFFKIKLHIAEILLYILGSVYFKIFPT
jgi:hypothetical protein